MSKYTFGVSTPEKFYDLFVESVNDYLTDVVNVRKAMNVAMFAFHLTDWLYQENIASTGQKFSSTELGNFRKSLNCDALNIMHDIINGSKHFVLREGSDKAIKETSTHDGDFDPNDYDSEDYDVSSLEITLKNGSTTDFQTQIIIVKDFWDNYFENKAKSIS